MSGVPIGKAKYPDETSVYRNIDNVEELSKLPEDEPCTVYELIQTAFEKFKDEYYLGSIIKDKSTGQPGDQVKWRTFGEVKDYVDKLANGLWHLIGKDTNSSSENKQSTVAFYGPNSFELWTGDLACSYHKLISVGIFDTYGEDTAIEVLNNCEASIIFTTSHKLPFILANHNKLKFLKVVVCVDGLLANDTQNSSSAILRKWAKSTNNINLLSYEELLKLGTDHTYPLHKPSGEDIAAICYTSGTSGTPKGAMQTHLNFISSTYYSSLILRNFDERLITFSYLPLAHTYERVLQYQLLWCGAQVGFYSGDITRFLRDIQIIKPVILPSVPRLLNRLKDTITENYSKSSNEDTATLFKLGLEAKLSLLKEEGICVHEDWDKLIFNKISQFLGGSIQIIITGSAPLSEETKDFFKVCLGCIVIEGYGATETSANVTSNPASSNTPNQVGAPNGCNEIKLKSVPEMNYLRRDSC
ncbi:acetyl-CoA synthetase-like protein [Conidiobolus coronatus NRRL 28638]|uniref:Acetyl-CoA synthetase-like protein n=1 Tax=Conidiobolus coronatus (strain ATCC 28846 / CBS 209.66 / NRRL 28638) TaxID=796925 RepID=A0A137PIS0_CONC2|nr:acetyl-CoA synthetase-like protein [Conidiobolus coronatus NRRL 28638]|eukprot:KXN74893.1 acetyl-CoA synthetase-like protein [Conidiobolus coronatus NRRL 28638]